MRGRGQKLFADLTSVRIFTKVPYIWHCYHTECLEEEELLFADCFRSMEVETMARMDKRLDAAEMFWEH